MPNSRPCLICQEPTFGTIHNRCRRERAEVAFMDNDDDIGLSDEDGAWVPTGGIVRWVPKEMAS